jgi:7-cyano-7-deazaguanine synthase in queuosine biosynthesis
MGNHKKNNRERERKFRRERARRKQGQWTALEAELAETRGWRCTTEGDNPCGECEGCRARQRRKKGKNTDE